MAKRWRCPPDKRLPLSPTIESIPSGNSLIKALRFAASKASITRPRSIPSWLLAPYATLAAIVSLKRMTSWLTKAICRRTSAKTISSKGTSSKKIWPLVGLKNLGSKLTRVDLPPPEGPTNATTSPGLILRLMLLSASLPSPSCS